MRPAGLALALSACLALAAGEGFALDRASCGCDLSWPDPPNHETAHGDRLAQGRLVAAMDGGQLQSHVAVRRMPVILGRRPAAPAADGTLR
jgi:hypothetical protein